MVTINLGCEWIGTVTPLPFGAYPGMSWNESAFFDVTQIS
jgi:hypothetical protein